jgi:homocysteine S-methyltransferase
MDSRAFRAALAEEGALLLDGGLATQLEAQGADLTDSLWSARLLVEEPGSITEAHLAYYRAGARVAITASYQATFEGFGRRGLSHDEAVGLLGRSVDLADQARQLAVSEGIAGPLFVAASIGPYGAMLADGSEYRGGYGLTLARLRDFHRERLQVLAAAGPDVLAVETIPEVDEAVAVAELLGEVDGAAAWISFSCSDGGHLNSGAPVEEAVQAVAGMPGVLAVGLNCTAPQYADELIARMHAATALPIVVYPNSGEGWDPVKRRWIGAGPDRIDAAAATRWRAGGARLIGGCCRVTPDQIRLLGDGLAGDGLAATPLAT